MNITVVARNKSEVAADGPNNTQSVNRHVTFTPDTSTPNKTGQPSLNLTLQQLSEEDYASFKTGAKYTLSFAPIVDTPAK